MVEGNISVVIPMYNEEQNVTPLLEELYDTLSSHFKNFEIIVINDASTDNTLEKLMTYKTINKISIINNNSNLGQGASVIIGSQSAQNDVVVTIDGDLQVDPKDIIKLYNYRQSNNLDFVVSRRSTRETNGHFSQIPSLLGNVLIRIIYMVDLFDVGSSLKILPKAEIIKIPVFKNVHRYISIFLHHKGLSYEEIEVVDRKRNAGKSKYNSLKFLRALFEIILLKYKIKKYLQEA